MRSWPILVLALALAGSLAWGYTQSQQRGQLALQNENRYQQSFFRLQSSLANIEDQLANSLGTTSARLLRRQMSDLQVFATGAVENLAGLPLLNVKLEQTHQFLNRLNDTADRMELGAERGDGATPEDRAVLQELYDQARFLNQQLGNLSGVVVGGRIRWADTERITQATVDGTGRTPVLDGFAAIEQGLQPPPGEESALVPTVAPNEQPVSDLGEKVSRETAIQVATRFLDLPAATQPQADLANAAVPVYVVSFTKSNGVPVSVSVSEEGGHVLEVLDGRPVGNATLDRADVVLKARQFLAKNGLDPVYELAYDEYGDAGPLAVVTFAPVEDGLAIFHQRIKVRVARDNGEIVGYDAIEHWFKKRPRSMGQARLSEAEAAAHLAPGLAIDHIRLGVVDTDRDGETLVYRVVARNHTDRYEVYIDAMTGEEVKVSRLEPEA